MAPAILAAMSQDAAPGTLRCSAPARANLIGNPSDWYGGAVLAASVPLRARVRLEPADRIQVAGPDGQIDIAGPGDLEPRGDSLDLARAVLRALGPGPACRIEYATEIPRQSGLAGSTALLVALLRALLAWRGEHPGPYRLASRARAVERDVLGVACGWTDAYMCVFGGVQYMDFRGLEWDRPLGEAPFATLEALADALPRLPIVLAQSGVRHHSG
ncbi:MAG: galactokinase family protein, partial [Myxococcota bacterium]